MNGYENGSKTIVTTIEVDKKLFLRLKALCALKELRISAEIEKMIRERMEELGKNSDSLF